MRYPLHFAAALLALSTAWPESATAGYRNNIAGEPEPQDERQACLTGTRDTGQARRSCDWPNSSSGFSPGVVRPGFVIGVADARALGLEGSIETVGYSYDGPCAYSCSGSGMTIAQSQGAQRDNLNTRLDELYRQLAAAQGPEKAAGLRAERAAWEKSTRARCDKEVPYYRGTGWRLSYTRCKNRAAAAHIKTLEARLRKLGQ